jgi:hypothetical protein
LLAGRRESARSPPLRGGLQNRLKAALQKTGCMFPRN